MRKDGWIAAAVFLLDRVTKLLWPRIPPEGQILIPGVLRLFPARNTGMAFSLFSGRPWLLALLSLGVIGGLLWALRRMNLSRLSRIGLMMMVGGGLGNLADRFFSGFVPDFLELLFIRFPVFNIADACLTAGCALCALGLLRGDKHG